MLLKDSLSLKDVLNVFDDSIAERIEGISYDGSAVDFKLELCYKDDDDEYILYNVYLFFGGTNGDTGLELKSESDAVYIPNSIIDTYNKIRFLWTNFCKGK